MQQHLEEISVQVQPGAHALMLLDRAGWHTTKRLDVPANITLLPLPPRSPELNPAENVWQYIRNNWLSDIVFEDQDDIQQFSFWRFALIFSYARSPVSDSKWR